MNSEAAPAPGKRPLAFVLGITADMAFAAACVLRGVARFPPSDDFDVLIFHDGLPRADRARLAGLGAREFVRYECPAAIRAGIPADSLRAFSAMVYAKYECFALLERYACVIWLDADVLVRGELRTLLARSATGAAFAREHKPLGFNFSASIAGFDMEAPFFNAGVFGISDSLTGWEQARDWLIAATARHAAALVMGEQGILNLWLQHRGVEPCSLLPEYNVFRHREDAATGRLVHAVGHHKPWMDFGDAQWNADYAHWLALGGTPCPLWKTVRFMATRRPHPLQHLRALPSRAREILHFLRQRRALLRAARAGRRGRSVGARRDAPPDEIEHAQDRIAVSRGQNRPVPRR